MRLQPGTRLGTYDIVSPLGAGGMGEVYRARDVRLRREVAIKVLPADVAADPVRLARFEHEARTVAALSHPNIVTLFSLEDDGATRFLTMELVEGETLDRLVVAGGLPAARLLEIAIPLATALAAAHSGGVTHRDLKPTNVIVTRDGILKVLDFGLAKLTVAQPAHDAAVDMFPTDLAETRTALPASMIGQVVGTLPYMAPEQVRGETADARTDLFAFGVVLYELAAGRRPFTGGSAADIASAILRDTPPPLPTLRADLPAGLHDIVNRCLEKDRGRRFQAATEIARALRAVERALPDGPATQAYAAPSDAQGATAAMRRTPPVTVAPTSLAPSIAVLPFVNRSRDEADEYFSDGLADDLLTMLAKIRGLRVSARSSAFSFKGTTATVGEVGRKLGVATVLEGSVRKSGARIRISVQLVNVADESPMWSEVYDRLLDDIFAVQDDIAQSVVKELRATLLGADAESHGSGDVKAEVEKAARGRGHDAEAHRLFLQGRALLGRFSRGDATRAIAYLRQAVARDPSHALAWAEIARTLVLMASVNWIPQDESYEEARQAVNTALALEAELPEAYVTLGRIQLWHDWDWRGSTASLHRAFELAPQSPVVLRAASQHARMLGRLDEAVDLSRRAVDQDPLYPAAHSNLAFTLRVVRRYAESETAQRMAIELSPLMADTRSQLALVLLALGRGEEAIAALGEEPEEICRLRSAGIIHQAMGHPVEANEALRKLVEKYADVAAYQIAQVHGAWGEADATFAWLYRAIAQHDTGTFEVAVETEFDTARRDPRWGEFLAKFGYEV